MSDTPKNPAEARAQESEFFGVDLGFDYGLDGGGVWTLPFPRYFPPDMRMRWVEHLRFISEDLDTERIDHPVTGKSIKRTKFPQRIKGKLIDEDVLLCIALMGTAPADDAGGDRQAFLADGTLPETYERFLAAGGVPGQISQRMQMMNRQMEERLRRDAFRD